MSKPFTTAALVLLVRAGKLSLDDPVRKYVPELPDFSVPLTIRPCCGTPVECQLLGTRSSATIIPTDSRSSSRDANAAGHP